MASPPLIALVLNAHLPFVRKPQFTQFYEERWLFEVISETYLPLLRMFRKLELENIPFKVSMVFSPTLLAMLSDSLLCERYVTYLDNQIELAEKEKKQAGGQCGVRAPGKYVLRHVSPQPRRV